MANVWSPLSAWAVKFDRLSILDFRGKYDAILTQRFQEFDSRASVGGTPYRRVERLHYDHIQAQRAEVEAMLYRLMSLAD